MLAAAGIAFLYGRTRNRPIGAIDAAVTRLGFQHSFAGRAFIEPLTGVGWHRLFDGMPALRAGDRGFENYFVCLRRHNAYPVRMRNPARIGSSTSSR